MENESLFCDELIVLAADPGQPGQQQRGAAGAGVPARDDGRREGHRGGGHGRGAQLGGGPPQPRQVWPRPRGRRSRDQAHARGTPGQGGGPRVASGKEKVRFVP